jgi:sugar O-acyltransferase (sialic acid O-acetyltransferase NeuD family)
MTISCVILCGGGHTRVLIDALQAAGKVVPYGILDSDPNLWGTEMFGIPILGDDTLLPKLIGQPVTHFVVGLGGNSKIRQRLFEKGFSASLEPMAVIHPAAVCSRWAELGQGVQLLPGSIVNPGAKLGANVIINSGAIVEHDCSIGDYVHVATGAKLAGTVSVGPHAYIGAGATIKQNINIGEGAIVGAGAVVIKDVPPHTVVAGVPARPLYDEDLKA